MDEGKLSTESAGRVYSRRTGRDAEVDSRWGLRWAALEEVRARLVRGVVDWDRDARGARKLPPIEPLPGWVRPAYEELSRAASDEMGAIASKGWLLGVPRFAEAVSMLVAGAAAEDAARLLGEQGRVLATLAGPAGLEFEAGARTRARADTDRAFVMGTRTWFAWIGQPELVRPSTLMLLAACAGLHPIPEGRAAEVREVWEKRLSRWKGDPIRGPFGEPLDGALTAAQSARRRSSR